MNQKVKEAIRAKKTAFRAWLTNKSPEQLRLRYSAACKTAATIVKQSKEKSWEKFGQKLDTDWVQNTTPTDRQTKYFGKPYAFARQTNTSCHFHRRY